MPDPLFLTIRPDIFPLPVGAGGFEPPTSWSPTKISASGIKLSFAALDPYPAMHKETHA